MCLAALLYRRQPHPSISIAANRDEDYARPSAPPAVEKHGEMFLVAPRDLRAGGTWIGVNQYGLFAFITNRGDLPAPRVAPGAAPLPSRGALVLEALTCRTLDDALRAIAARAAEPFAPYNLVLGDLRRRVLVEGRGTDGVRVAELETELSIISNHGAADDRGVPVVELALRRWESAGAAAPRERALRMLRTHADEGRDRIDEDRTPAICRHGAAHGTVSSTLIELDDRSLRMEHAAGPPCTTPFLPVVIPGRFLAQ